MYMSFVLFSLYCPRGIVVTTPSSQVTSLKRKMYSFLCACACACACACVCVCVCAYGAHCQGRAEGKGCSGTGVTDGYELSDEGAGD